MYKELRKEIESLLTDWEAGFYDYGSEPEIIERLRKILDKVETLTKDESNV